MSTELYSWSPDSPFKVLPLVDFHVSTVLLHDWGFRNDLNRDPQVSPGSSLCKFFTVSNKTLDTTISPLPSSGNSYVPTPCLYKNPTSL